jgi:uncharacterized protein (TIGR02679 family)
VLAALFAATSARGSTAGRVLILDELGDSLGDYQREAVLHALSRTAREAGITVLGTCQDGVLEDAARHCGLLLYFRFHDASDILNAPTRVFGTTHDGTAVEQTAPFHRTSPLMLGDPIPLNDVPDGCVARPRLVAAPDGTWRLPKDRSGRSKIPTVELSAASQGDAMLPDGADRRFLLGRESRRWPTIVGHYGNDTAAWGAAVELCRAGLVNITCGVIAALLGPPRRWCWTDSVRAHAESRRQTVADAARQAREMLAAANAGDEPPWVAEWLGDVARSGVVARSPEDARALLSAAAACLAALPPEGAEPIGRSELAVRYGGARGAHALDDGHRLAALVLRGIAAATSQPYPRTAAERRVVWSSAGVTCDTTSATVLVANLRPELTGLVATQLRDRAYARLPTHLTARDLATAALLLPGTSVYVCENPRVLEAALDRGVNAPLVCTAGTPTMVTAELLRQLTASGARIFYRGDFDWPGIAIANRLLGDTGCTTWRYGTATYVAAVKRANGDLVPLTGKPVTATWDDNLTGAMLEHGAAIHEELLLDDLVTGLLER